MKNGASGGNGSTHARIRVGSLPLDAVDFDGAIQSIEALVDAGKGGAVFTPNVDHIVLAEQNQRFRQAYQQASLSLVDGMPVLWASRLLRKPLPMKVSGSDLIRPLMRRAAERRFRVYMLGGAPGIAHEAAQILKRDFPGLEVCGTDDSRVDIDRVDPDVLKRISDAAPHIVLVALGAPKQEIFSIEQREVLGPAVAIGIGASLDFIAGVKKRAPRWISYTGFEWLYRLVQEPRRLASRYLLRDPRFFFIVARQLREER